MADSPVFPLLYSRTVRGQTQMWQIVVSGHRFRTIEGIVDGVLTVSEWTTCQAKNVGRANATSASEQAAKEAAARHQRKIGKGYSEDKMAIDLPMFKPMLAKSFDEYADDLVYPVYSQPKLDGIRCIATVEGLFTRNGKPIVAAPHVIKALAPFFAQYRHRLLDGELYNHELKHDFNRLVSLVKKTKPTEQDLEESARDIQYWVYDMYGEYEFGLRDTELVIALGDLNNPVIRHLRGSETPDRETLDKAYEWYLREGYEGQIVRANTPYENKRTKNLLKRKEMTSDEFELLDLQAGRGGAANHAARAILKTRQGDQFEAGIIGDHAYAAAILKDKARYIGKMATVIYQNMTPGDHPVPRFGKLKELDRLDA